MFVRATVLFACCDHHIWRPEPLALLAATLQLTDAIAIFIRDAYESLTAGKPHRLADQTACSPSIDDATRFACSMGTATARHKEI
jgi:hypothetical protein